MLKIHGCLISPTMKHNLKELCFFYFYFRMKKLPCKVGDADLPEFVIDRASMYVVQLPTGGPFPLRMNFYYICPRNFPGLDAYWLTTVDGVKTLYVIQVGTQTKSEATAFVFLHLKIMIYRDKLRCIYSYDSSVIAYIKLFMRPLGKTNTNFSSLLFMYICIADHDLEGPRL